MTIAPSFAGLTHDSRVTAIYRDQWPSISGTFVTFAASIDHYFESANSGIGAVVYRDVAGTGNFGLTEAGLQYSYKLKIREKRGNRTSDWFLRPGIYFKYAQRSLDFHALTFGDMIKPDGSTSQSTIEPIPLGKKGYIDFAASLMVYADLYWGGFSVDHILQPDQSLTSLASKLPIKISLFGGAKLLLKDKKRRRRKKYGKTPESLTLAFNYRAQGSYDQLDFGAYWEHDPIVLGAWFRGLPVISSGSYEKIDAVIALIGIKINKKINVGYSFDMTISSLLSHTGGAHEISLTYFFQGFGNNKGKYSIVPCPSF